MCPPALAGGSGRCWGGEDGAPGRYSDQVNNGDHGKSMVIVGYLAVVL